MRFHWIIAAPVIVALLCSTAVASPGAHILEVRGKVTITNTENRSRPAVAFGTVYEGERIIVGEGGSLAIGIRHNGKVERISKSAEVVLAKDGCEPKKHVTSVAVPSANEAEVNTAIKELPQITTAGATIPRGPPKKKLPPQVAPPNGARVMTPRPSFAWQPVANAKKYQLSLLADADVLWRPTPATETKLVFDKEDLKPGEYQWKVEKVEANGEKAELFSCNFYVATAEQQQEAAQLARLVASGDAALTALAARRFEDNLFIAEAIDAYERLAKVSDAPGPFLAALTELYEAAGRQADADSARQKAKLAGFQFEKQPAAGGASKDAEFDAKLASLQTAWKAKGRIDPGEGADLLSLALRSAGADQTAVHNAERMLMLGVWDPLLIDAYARLAAPDANRYQIEQQLRSQLDVVARRLNKAGAPPSISLIGQLHICGFQRQTGQVAECEKTLEDIAAVGVDPLVWEGFRAMYWNLRGLVDAEQEHYASAFECHARAISLRKQAGLKLDVAESLNNQGQLLLELGDYVAAGQLLRDALIAYDFERKASGQPATHLGHIYAELNLARSEDGRREFDLARQRLDQLSATIGKLQGQNELLAIFENNRALACYNQGQYVLCESILNKARAAAVHAFGADHLHVAEVDVNLGWTAMATGRTQEAEKRFRQALALLKAHYDRHHRTPEVMAYLARAIVSNGGTMKNQAARRQEAQALFVDALARRATAVHNALGSAISERDRVAFVQKLRVHRESLAWPGVLDAYLELAPALEISAEQQYRQVLAWKGMLAAQARWDASGPGSEKTRGLVARRGEIRRQLRLQYRDSPQAQVAELELELAAQERELRRLQAARRDKPIPPSVAEVTASLPPRCVLIDVIEARRFMSRQQGEPVRDSRCYVAFVVRPGGSVTRVELGESRSIDSAVRQLTSQISVAGKPVESQRKQVWRVLGRSLQQEAGDADLLIFCGDGALHQLPLSAMPGRTAEYWAEEIALAQVASAGSLLARRRAVLAPKTSGWLVVGGIDFGKPKGAKAGQEKWCPLPGTLAEARDIDHLLRDRLADHGLGGAQRPDKSLITGAEATKRAIVAALSSRRTAHLATHAFFAERRVDAFDVLDASAQLDSALVLASINRNANESDSLLTAEEIGECELGGLNLLVLSACSTSRGHTSAGQGVVGLLGSLDRAGARTVVSALWEVDDNATAALMKAFYGHLLDAQHPLSAAEALREAQRDMIRRYDSDAGKMREAAAKGAQPTPPYYWAAWTVTGDPAAMLLLARP